MKKTEGKLIVVSNRLPISLSIEKGKIQEKCSSGGLISALEPLLKAHGGIWVGSPGGDGSSEVQRLVAEATRHEKHDYAPVFLTEEERRKFYLGFSNEVIWPLFHDLQSRCNFDPEYWRVYLEVNGKFAEAIWKVSQDRDLIWIHDYQLMQTARFLRKRRPHSRLAFFLHIPFPAPDIFEKLPWRAEILDGLLEHDLIGLQTRPDVRNLIACLHIFAPGVKIASEPAGRIAISGKRRVRIHSFPISIDYRNFAEAASSECVTRRTSELRAQLRNMRVAIGVDRLDYTKGIPERLKAFRLFLRRSPEFHRIVQLVQIVVPSREDIPGYQDLKSEVERLAAEVNGEFGEPGWIPVNYMHRSIPREELLAIYRAADLALITPLKDGMNLVAKEYCAARVEADGALILSEFAGAAPELRTGALLVNPYDEEGVAAALNEALRMPPHERKRRMTRMRNQIRKSDVLKWRDRFLAACEGL